MRGHLPKIPTKGPQPFNFFNYQTVTKVSTLLPTWIQKRLEIPVSKVLGSHIGLGKQVPLRENLGPQSVLGAPGKAVRLTLLSVPLAISSLDFCILFVTAQARGRATDLYIAVTMTLTCEYLLKTSLVFSSSCAATLNHCTGGEQSLFSFTELLSLSIAVKKERKKFS